MNNLSHLNESGIFGSHMSVIETDNAIVKLRDIHDNVHSYLDFMSAYGSVNFGHCCQPRFKKGPPSITLTSISPTLKGTIVNL
jgi:hypothetical protein